MGLIAVIVSIAAVIVLTYTYWSMLQNTLSVWLGWSEAQETAEPVKSTGESESTPADNNLESEDATTPKARAKPSAKSVPAFTLDAGDDVGATPDMKKTIPQTPSASVSPITSRGPTSSSSGLMPPPSLPVQRKSAPTLAPSLRMPTTGPLPNRGLPAHSQQRVQASLAPNGAISTPNSRNKVLLTPGHSPMDWAALTRKGNLSGVDRFQRITPSQLKQMTGRKGKPAWSSWQGKVYNITPYLAFHPGGEPELMKAAGRDGTKLFMDVHPWVNWENMLSSCLVGVLIAEEITSPLEEMD